MTIRDRASDPIGAASSAALMEALDVLDGVRQTGFDWEAICPVHGDDGNRVKLQINAKGKVMPFCAGGCSSASVKAAIYERMGQAPETAPSPPRPVRQTAVRQCDEIRRGQRIAEQIREMDEAPKPKTQRQIEREEEQAIIAAPALMAKHFEPLQWAVPGMIPEGLTVLAGGTKTGKSWLSLHLGVAIPSGGAAFGQIPVERGEVLYLALEDSQRRLQDRLKILLQGSPPPAGLYLVTHWDLLGEGFVERLDAWLTEHPACRMVIVDVFQKIRSARKQAEIQYDADYVAMTALQDLPKEHRVSVVVLHHTRKMTASDPFDMVSGSVGITGGADSVLVLMRQRDQKDATLHSIGREGPFDAMALEWDDKLCLWNLMGKAEDHVLSAERKQILAFMRKAKTDLGPAEVAGALGMNPASVRYLLGQMVEDGQIIKSHYGKYTMTEMQKLTQGAHTPYTPTPLTPLTPSRSHEDYEPGGEV